MQYDMFSCQVHVLCIIDQRTLLQANTGAYDTETEVNSLMVNYNGTCKQRPLSIHRPSNKVTQATSLFDT